MDLQIIIINNNDHQLIFFFLISLPFLVNWGKPYCREKVLAWTSSSWVQGWCKAEMH